ncbi:hypothetical protein HN873_012919 [Arachis hypogaea]
MEGVDEICGLNFPKVIGTNAVRRRGGLYELTGGTEGYNSVYMKYISGMFLIKLTMVLGLSVSRQSMENACCVEYHLMWRRGNKSVSWNIFAKSSFFLCVAFGVTLAIY